MSKWIYRILRPDSRIKMERSSDTIAFQISHPFVWNVASSISWDYAKKPEAENPSENHLSKHQKSTNVHLDGRIGLISNLPVIGKIPDKPGVNDPFEGYIIDYSSIQLSSNRTQIRGVAKTVINNKWRSICFSVIEAEKNQITELIEVEVKKGNYSHDGKNYRDYVYGKMTDDIFFRLASSVSKLSRRVGATVVKVNYFDINGVAEADIGKIIFPPHAGIGGMFLNLDAGCFEKLTAGDHVLLNEEAAKFRDEIESAIPFKYKPAYGIEKEIRFLWYGFDGWKNDQIIVEVDNNDQIFKFGTYRGSINQ